MQNTKIQWTDHTVNFWWGWPTAHSESDTFNPDDDAGDWLIKVCFPRIPKPSRR